MTRQYHFNILSSNVFDSRVKSLNVRNTERWLGFLVGPSIAACMFAICGQTYLNVFYTDVLKMSPIAGGMFLAVMPVISKIIDAVTNLIMGRMIDNTHSKRGKARPWILVAGPLLTISGVLLFAVPTRNLTIQLIWVTASYNLFFCISYTVYNISNTLLVPLSTRNNKQRDTLAMASSMAINMVPGILVAMLFPMVFLPYIGVDQSRWIIVLSVISVLAIPASLIQYYFTRERITEDAQVSTEENKPRSLREQMKGCFSSRYWLIIMGIIIINLLANNLYVTSLIYYSNWVLGTYNDGKTFTMLNVIGQAPLGMVFILWPLVKKTGKRNAMLGGGFLSIAGSIIGFLFPTNLTMVLGGLMIRSFGNLPLTYVMLAMLADSLDHVEWVNGFRCDGFSSSLYSIAFTVCSGIAIGIFNYFLGTMGYTAPAVEGSWVPQSQAVQNFFIYGVFIILAIVQVFIMLMLLSYKVEKELPKIQRDITARHKAEAEARGEIYVSPEEKARLEQEELDRAAEEKRKEELRAHCDKKGISFEAEEAKYQQKTAKKNVVKDGYDNEKRKF